jgi:hypothetical protein
MYTRRGNSILTIVFDKKSIPIVAWYVLSNVSYMNRVMMPEWMSSLTEKKKKKKKTKTLRRSVNKMQTHWFFQQTINLFINNHKHMI